MKQTKIKSFGKKFSGLMKDIFYEPPNPYAQRPPEKRPPGMSLEEYDNWYESYYAFRRPPKTTAKKTTAKKTTTKRTTTKKTTTKRKSGGCRR